MKPSTKIRVSSALIAVISLAAIIKLGGYVGVAITAFFVSLLALAEFSRMVLPGDRYKWTRIYFVGMGLIAFLTSIVRNELILHSFVLTTLLVMVFFLLMAKDPDVPLEDLVNKAGLSLLGIIYAGVCPVYICLLTKLSPHLEWFIYTFFVVFSGDTAAYFVGTKWGKTKLYRRISPNKSVEGAIASLFASVLFGMLVRQFFLPNTDPFLMLALSILTSVVAQMGDLCESFIKRTFHTKDSGSIMPGHGGLLDRVDGVLFGAPVVYIYAKYLILVVS